MGDKKYTVKNITYRRRIEQGLCIRCGKNKATNGQKCRDCQKWEIEKYHSDDRSTGYVKQEYKAEHLKGVSNPNTKLDADAKEAFEAGMTYGKWRMIQDMKKRGEHINDGN